MKTTLDIQKRLGKLGFSPGPFHRVMDAKTEPAIIACKRSVGLEARAYIGPATLEQLFGRDTVQGTIGTGEPRSLTLARKYSGLKEIRCKPHAREALEMWRVLALPYRGWPTSGYAPWRCCSSDGLRRG